MLRRLIALAYLATICLSASKFVYVDSKMNKTTTNPQLILESDNVPTYVATWNDKIVSLYNATTAHITHTNITMPANIVHSVASTNASLLYTLMTGPSSIDVRTIGALVPISPNLALNQGNPMTQIVSSSNDKFLATFDNTPAPTISVWQVNKDVPASIKLTFVQNITDIVGNLTAAKFCNGSTNLIALANSSINVYEQNKDSSLYSLKGSYPLSATQTALQVSANCQLVVAGSTSNIEIMHNSHHNGNYIKLPNVTYNATPVKMMKFSKDASYLAIVSNTGTITEQSRAFTGNFSFPSTCNYTYTTCLFNCSKDVFASILNGFQLECTCVDKYLWSAAYGRCQVNCQLQPNHETNASQCACMQNFVWNESTKKCQLICKADNLTVGFNQTTGICGCTPSGFWNNISFMCQRNCTNFPNAIGADLSKLDRCACITNFTWRDETSACAINCTDTTRTSGWVSNTECKCNLQYVWNQNLSMCVVNCQKFNLAMPDPLKVDECLCPASYVWTAWPNGCMTNCSQVNGSISRGMAQVCACPAKMSMIYGACRLDCRKISYSTTSNGGSACNCIANYKWDSLDKICKRRTNWAIILGLIVPLIILGIVGIVFCLISCKKGVWRRQSQGPSHPTQSSAFDRVRPDVNELAPPSSQMIMPPALSVSQVGQSGANLVQPATSPNVSPVVSPMVRDSQMGRPNNQPFGYFNNSSPFKPGAMGVVGGPPLLTGSNVFAPTNQNRIPPRPAEDLLRFSNVMPVQAPSTIPLPPLAPSSIPPPPPIIPPPSTTAPSIRPQVVLPPPPFPVENIRKLVEPRPVQEAPLSSVPSVPVAPPPTTVVLEAPVSSSPRSPRTPPPQVEPSLNIDIPAVGPAAPRLQSPRTSPREN